MALQLFTTTPQKTKPVQHLTCLLVIDQTVSCQQKLIAMKGGDSNETIQQAKTTAVLRPEPRRKDSGSGTDYGGEVTILDGYKQVYTNCVSAARLFRPDLPQSGSRNATPQAINSQIPTVGAVAIQATHVSIVVEVREKDIVVKDGNFKKGYLTQRTIPKKAIKGYWN